MHQTEQELELTDEFLGELRKDERWRSIQDMVRVEQELRDSLPLQMVLKVVEKQANDALDLLVTADPTDAKLITSLQAKVLRARIIGNTLDAVTRKGAIAEQSLKDEQEGVSDGGEGGYEH